MSERMIRLGARCLVGLALLFLWAACGKGGPAFKTQDWKEIYLKELTAAQEYCAAADWEHFTLDSKYPILLYAAELIDLNFDGTPELCLFGPGAGGSEEMRILAIANDGSVRMIFNDWGNVGQFTLYRKLGTESYAFGFQSANGDMENWKGAYYLSGEGARMDGTFPEAARFAEFSERIDMGMNADMSEIVHLRGNYTFNGREVSEYDYGLLKENMLAGYEEVPYRSTAIFWGSEGYGDSFSIRLLDERDLASFLDAYDDEDGMGGYGYNEGGWEHSAEDYYRDELIRHVLGNVESAAELVNEHGMSVLITGETIELDGRLCHVIVLGTDHAEHFVQEIFYAIYNLEDIYRYDPVEDVWHLIYVFGAVG